MLSTARNMVPMDDEFPPLKPGYIEHSNGRVKCRECGTIYGYRVVSSPTNLIWTEGKCPKCSGPMTAEEKRREAIERSARIQADVDRIFGHWNLMNDEAYEHMTLDSFTPADLSQEKALRVLREYRPDRGNVLLRGPAGVGKTHLAIGLIRIYSDRGYSTLAIKSHDIFNRMRRAWSSKEDGAEVAVINALRNVGILLIDDLGIDNSKDTVNAKFYEIMDYRSGRKPTIFTTNMSIDEMAGKKGAALTSRINTRATDLVIGGIDYRAKDNNVWWQDIGKEVGVNQGPERR